MAGAALYFRLEGDRRLSDFLDRMIRRAKSPATAYRRIGEFLEKSHKERWLREVSPDGVPWESLSEEYANSRRKRGSAGAGRILILDYVMQPSVEFEAGFGGVTFGTDVEYAATHQYGDADRNIPARPFLGVSAHDKEEILSVLSEFIVGI